MDIIYETLIYISMQNFRNYNVLYFKMEEGAPYILHANNPQCSILIQEHTYIQHTLISLPVSLFNQVRAAKLNQSIMELRDRDADKPNTLASVAEFVTLTYPSQHTKNLMKLLALRCSSSLPAGMCYELLRQLPSCVLAHATCVLLNSYFDQMGQDKRQNLCCTHANETFQGTLFHFFTLSTRKVKKACDQLDSRISDDICKQAVR